VHIPSAGSLFVPRCVTQTARLVQILCRAFAVGAAVTQKMTFYGRCGQYIFGPLDMKAEARTDVIVFPSPRSARLSSPSAQSAKATGKRRARSPSLSTAPAPPVSKRRKTATDPSVSSYNLRSRLSDEVKSKGKAKAQPSNPANKKKKMPRRNTRAGKAKAVPASGTVNPQGTSASASTSSASATRGRSGESDVRMEVEDQIAVSGLDMDVDEDVVMEADEDSIDDEDEHDDEGDSLDGDDVVHHNDEDEEDEDEDHHVEDDDDYPRSPGGLGAGGGSSDPYEGMGSFAASLRGLTGMMAGLSSRLKTILARLRDRHNPSERLIALQELSEVLSMSTEDTLAGYFSPEQYSKELVAILSGSSDDSGFAVGGEEGGVEMMLLACRCLANMMEALPGSTSSVVYAGAVPILCAKLLEIQFIDLAEQTLSVRCPLKVFVSHCNAEFRLPF
jgi:E3 ubiquitin-protein ligase TRIP12